MRYLQIFKIYNYNPFSVQHFSSAQNWTKLKHSWNLSFSFKNKKKRKEEKEPIQRHILIPSSIIYCSISCTHQNIFINKRKRSLEKELAQRLLITSLVTVALLPSSNFLFLETRGEGRGTVLRRRQSDRAQLDPIICTSPSRLFHKDRRGMRMRKWRVCTVTR